MGALGEEIAARFLVHHGARIEGRNIEIGRGEIDIVAIHGRVRTVVEVKTVTTAAPRTGAEAVDETKSDQLRSLAASLDPPVQRIDIVDVLLDENGASVRWLRWV